MGQKDIVPPSSPQSWLCQHPGLPGEERKTPGNTHSPSSQNAGPCWLPSPCSPSTLLAIIGSPPPPPPPQTAQGMETGGCSKFRFSCTGLQVSTPTSSELGWGQWLHGSHMSRNAALLSLRGQTPSLRQGGHSMVPCCEGLTGSQSSTGWWGATSPNRPHWPARRLQVASAKSPPNPPHQQ